VTASLKKIMIKAKDQK